MTHFSPSSFIVGILAGAIVGSILGGGGMLFVIKNNLPGTWEDRLLQGDVFVELQQEIAEGERQRSRTAFGTIVSIGDGSLAIEVSLGLEKEVIEFRYDDNTKFIRIENDAELTEVLLSPNDFARGDQLEVESDTVISNTENPYAKRVIRY